MVDQTTDWYAHALFRAHPCWISPQWALEYLQRDRAAAQEWVRLCQAAHLDTLLFVTKPVDGLWLDILRIGRHDQDCLCAYCRADFARCHPSRSLVAEQGTAVSQRWRIASLDGFLADTRAMAHSLRPGLPVTFNDAGLTY